jgi:WD40 repeat protein
VNDTHQRHAHTVQYYEGSYNDHECRNTFCTAAADNTVKLWDMRAGAPVREFSGGHTNRSLTIGFAASNCYKYLLTGSEDRAAVVYDVASGQAIGKTKGKDHGDSVIDVAINPVAYEWSSACIDGYVRTFREPAVKLKQPRAGNPPPN